MDFELLRDQFATISGTLEDSNWNTISLHSDDDLKVDLEDLEYIRDMAHVMASNLAHYLSNPNREALRK